MGELLDLEMEGVDASASENLILRADGRTAGGPILDVENKQRAAGGTWRFFQAEYIGENDDDDDLEGGNGASESRVTTRLNVRLVIPPKKDKVLVMEGEVKRGGVSSAFSSSEANLKEMRSLSSSIDMMPDSVDDGDVPPPQTATDGFLQCTGQVWVEDAVAGKGGDRNRSMLGKFSMLKMKDRNPNEYVYTVPAPKKFQD